MLIKTAYKTRIRSILRSIIAHRTARRSIITFALAMIILLSIWTLDTLYPPHLPSAKNTQNYASVVLANDGTPLRAFADQRGIWRHPISPSQVSPRFIEALLGFEDRWFYHHPGVNPLALIRATGQAIWNGRIVSGGSTLTMQVARLLQPDLARRSIGNKLLQIARALQLEWHLSKTEILTLYLNHAPYGGTIEGIEAASRAYLGHSAQQLSYAEAALLAVLPQAPSRLRPDRHPARAQAARDKVLARLQKQAVWNTLNVKEAYSEFVSVFPLEKPHTAALLARRLRNQRPQTERIQTSINHDLQTRLEADLRNQSTQLPAHSSMAILVVRNRDMAVQAYVGSADFFNNQRFGHVDMIRATRSPGSTLKPLLYALALEEGLIHSQSLLIDAPLDFDGYRPHNFNGQHQGAVSASKALQASLNVPAVSLLQHLGAERFVSRLRHGGLQLKLAAGAKPNPAIILGGIGSSLESLVSAYASLARKGLSAPLRFSDSDPLNERRLLSPGAAWITANMLAEQPLPESTGGFGRKHQIAWKTGTSYGYRDAWAIGVTPQYTIGVWAGRPDGSPVPGQYGAITAVPVLARTLAELPTKARHNWRQNQPLSVTSTDICWPTGKAANLTPDNQCHKRKTAWVLNDTIPLTLAGNPATETINPLLLKIRIDTLSGNRVLPGCQVTTAINKIVPRWPIEVQPWLSTRLRELNKLPPLAANCSEIQQTNNQPLEIKTTSRIIHLRPTAGNHDLPHLQLHSRGGNGQLRWLINNRLISQQAHLDYQFQQSGDFRITVIDQAGSYDTVLVRVDANANL